MPVSGECGTLDIPAISTRSLIVNDEYGYANRPRQAGAVRQKALQERRETKQEMLEAGTAGMSFREKSATNQRTELG
jgi:hypothetical protein